MEQVLNDLNKQTTNGSQEMLMSRLKEYEVKSQKLAEAYSSITKMILQASLNQH